MARPKIYCLLIWSELYQWRRLSFVLLTNAVSEFQRMIKSFVEQTKPKCCFPYLDDTNVAGIDQADHFRNLTAFYKVAKRHSCRGMKLLCWVRELLIITQSSLILTECNFCLIWLFLKQKGAVKDHWTFCVLFSLDTKLLWQNSAIDSILWLST